MADKGGIGSLIPFCWLMPHARMVSAWRCSVALSRATRALKRLSSSTAGRFAGVNRRSKVLR